MLTTYAPHPQSACPGRLIRCRRHRVTAAICHLVTAVNRSLLKGCRAACLPMVLATRLPTRGRPSCRLCMIALCLLVTVPPAVIAPVARAETADGCTPDALAAAYTRGRASRDGIGKFYLGREISHVMGHLGAGWLERPAREREERTDLLLEALALAPDAVVADIGAGTGFFTLPMAAAVPEGRVYAVDIQIEMLEIIRRRRDDAGLTNIEPVRGTASDPRLPGAGVDLVLMVDAYHEFAFPAEMMCAVAASLAPGGRVILVEYRAEDPSVPIKPLHKMSQAQAEAELAAAGLTLISNDDRLPRQHILVFGRDAD